MYCIDKTVFYDWLGFKLSRRLYFEFIAIEYS